MDEKKKIFRIDTSIFSPSSLPWNFQMKVSVVSTPNEYWGLSVDLAVPQAFAFDDTVSPRALIRNTYLSSFLES